MEMNRVTRIQVNKLFDEIDYDIVLDEEKPVGILIAPNGRGKTTILKLISFVVNPSYDLFMEIKDIPFSSFVCHFSNGKRIELKQLPTKNKIMYDREADELDRNALAHSGKNAVKRINDFEYRILPSNREEDDCVRLSDFIKYKSGENGRHIDEDDYDLLDPDLLDLVPEKTVYKLVNPETSRRLFEIMLPRYIEKNLGDKRVVFIETSRLQAKPLIERRLSPSAERRLFDPLLKASNYIAHLVFRARENYNIEVSKAKDRLPRLFLENESAILPLDVFLEKWNKYTEELEKFRKIGLIGPSKGFISDKEIPHVYEKKKEFLNTYLEAFQHTIEPLNDIYKRLNLFKTIFDERNRITHKTVKCGTTGIELYCRDKLLELSDLSSGEKHDFIMFYNLIFRARENSLILVDEPEISLHIEWQESYLDHLIEICKANHMQAIVATHSPNIVSSHYDCLLDMGEQNADS